MFYFCRVVVLLIALLGATLVWGNNGHYVTLTWTPSILAVGHPTLAYNLYRNTKAGAPLAAPINPVPGAAGCTVAAHDCVYNDYDVLGGSTYFYTATAVLNGAESDRSNEARADVPLAAPTGVTLKIK
jgi:hypothetical protein